MRSQNDRILDRLRAGPLCAMEPLDWTPRIYRTAARIDNLKKSGHDISSRMPCYYHHEPERHAVYELADQDQERLF